jgi:hypothetical protein
MAKKFTLDQLTEGIRQRDVGQQSALLTEKWTRTGLLRGMDDTGRENMARLLENQAAQLLREQSSIGNGARGTASSGDLRGFTNIAFPIVRRVFGGLVANDLVSIQPMSLPSGLLFYLDYTYGTNVGGSSTATGAAGTEDQQDYRKGQSIYNLPTGKGVRSGSDAIGGQYNLAGTGYTRVNTQLAAGELVLVASGAYAQQSTLQGGQYLMATGSDGKLLQFDPQITTLIEENAASTGVRQGKGLFQAMIWDVNNFPAQADLTAVKEIGLYAGGAVIGSQANGTSNDDVEALVNGLGVKVLSASDSVQGGQIVNIRRLNQLGIYTGGVFTPDPMVTRSTVDAALLTIISGTFRPDLAVAGVSSYHGFSGSYVQSPTLNVGGDGDTLTIPTFESNFGTGSTDVNPQIPEIDIKIESIAVTAETRKLRARWSPELAQDLNAYHSLDAEVELTQILSEQIALELDREILNDLLTQAKGANYYWSRAPGKFVNKKTGAVQSLASALQTGPNFTGTVREWYETLVETIIDVANEIHRKTLRGSANFIVVSPDVATIFEASVLYKPNYSLDGQGQVGSPFQLGAAPIGSLSNRFTVYKDPYFPRNKVLVGYKGGSYLETGYVYAPYVPLIVTPTIFAPEDFTPRKGVMTRYGKKMVRADFYGTVTCMDMDVI